MYTNHESNKPSTSNRNTSKNMVLSIRDEYRKQSNVKLSDFQNKYLNELLVSSNKNSSSIPSNKIVSNLVKDHLKIRSAYDRQIEDLNETLQRLAREKA